MKDLRHWVSFLVYVMMWVFVFKLFEIYTQKYTENNLKKICIGGIIVVGIIYNMDYIKH